GVTPPPSPRPETGARTSATCHSSSGNAPTMAAAASSGSAHAGRLSRRFRTTRRMPYSGRCALRLAALRPRALAAGVLVHRHHALVAREAGRLLGGEVDEHGGERDVVADLVEHELVERVAVRVPRVRAVAPVERAQAEGRCTGTDEGRVVAAAAARQARHVQLDVLR